MRLNGNVELAVAPEAVRAALNRPEVLRAMLPGDCTVKASGPGRFDFTLKKGLGFLEIRQNGTITLDSSAPGAEVLTLTASHMIGGSVDLTVAIGLAPFGTGTAAVYDGTLTAKGLAGRVLRDREGQVKPYIQRVFSLIAPSLQASSRRKISSFRCIRFWRSWVSAAASMVSSRVSARNTAWLTLP